MSQLPEDKKGTVTLSAATYNVHAWTGTDGREDMDRTVRVIKALDADFVGLQEATLPLTDSIGKSQDALAEETGMYVAFGPTMLRRNTDFGNVLLTRKPYQALRRFDLSVRSRGEPRGAVAALSHIDEKRICVCTTHLGLSMRERYLQSRRLSAALLSIDPMDVIVVMGDLNEWIPGAPGLWPLTSKFGPSFSPRSFPARHRLFRLDRIFTTIHSGTQGSVHVENDVFQTGEARIASDHLPVRTRIILKKH